MRSIKEDAELMRTVQSLEKENFALKKKIAELSEKLKQTAKREFTEEEVEALNTKNASE